MEQITKDGNIPPKDGGVTATTKLASDRQRQERKQRWTYSVADATPPETSPVTSGLLGTTSISSTPAVDSSPVPPNNTSDACLQDIPTPMAPVTPVHSQTDSVPCTITPKASQLFSAFATMHQHNLLYCTAGLDSLSASSLEGVSMVQAVSGPSLPLALKLLLYPEVPCKNFPRNEKVDEALRDEFNGIRQVEPGSPGHDWYLQVGIDYKDG